MIKKCLKVDDKIYCKDRDDLIETMTELAKNGVETDFFYPEGDDPVLIVTKIEEV